LHRLALQARAEEAELHPVLDHQTRLKMLRRSRSLRNAGVLAVIAADDVVGCRGGAERRAADGDRVGLLGSRLPVRTQLARSVVGPDLTPQVVLRLGYPAPDTREVLGGIAEQERGAVRSFEVALGVVFPCDAIPPCSCTISATILVSASEQ